MLLPTPSIFQNTNARNVKHSIFHFAVEVEKAALPFQFDYIKPPA